MKMKHTPGPWKITDKIDGQFAYTPRIHVGPAVVYYTAGYPTAEQDSEFKAIAEANARLIAAAPELLDELIEQDKFLGVLAGTVPLSEKDTHRRIAMHRESVRAAIAKATSRE